MIILNDLETSAVQPPEMVAAHDEFVLRIIDLVHDDGAVRAGGVSRAPGPLG
jgi:hypothetical protein